MPILRLAGKAPRRRRPVNSALGGKSSMVEPSSSTVLSFGSLQGELGALARFTGFASTQQRPGARAHELANTSTARAAQSSSSSFSIGAFRHHEDPTAALTSFGVRGRPSKSLGQQLVARVASARPPPPAVRHRQRLRCATSTNSLVARVRRAGHVPPVGAPQPGTQQPLHGSTPSCRLTRR